jgi:hypothetical protein
MNLHDQSDGHGSDLDEGQSSKMVGIKDLNLAFIAQQNIRLMLQRVPLDRP